MLSARQKTNALAAWAEDLWRVLNHGNAILEHKTRLDGVTRARRDGSPSSR
jgi:hypothetical protein